VVRFTCVRVGYDVASLAPDLAPVPATRPTPSGSRTSSSPAKAVRHRS